MLLPDTKVSLRLIESASYAIPAVRRAMRWNENQEKLRAKLSCDYSNQIESTRPQTRLKAPLTFAFVCQVSLANLKRVIHIALLLMGHLGATII